MPHTECLDKLNGYRAQLEANGTMEKLNTIRKTKEEIEHKRNLEMQSKNYADAGSW
jgi:hypothetical protein